MGEGSQFLQRTDSLQSSLGGASNGVRSPRTLAAVADSVAMALAGNVGWKGEG